MKGRQNKHEVFREPYAKKVKKNPLAELNSSKEEESDETCDLPVDTESDYVLKASKKRKKRDKKQELQLVTKIESIGLEEPSTSSSAELEHPTEHEEEDGEVATRNGTPVRKKKKSKKVLDKLCSIQEAVDEPSSEEQVKRKKKKNKRKLNEEDEIMQDAKDHRHKEKPVKKAKKVKLDDSYEASASDGDTADRINAEQQLLQSAKKLSKSQKKQEKLRLKNAYKALSVTNL